MLSKTGTLLLGIVLIIIVIAIFMFNTFKKTLDTEIVEMKTFSCDHMHEVSFNYPIFAGWREYHNQTEGDAECKILLAAPIKTKPTPLIRVSKTVYESLLVSRLARDNPQGVSYTGDTLNSFPGKDPVTVQNAVTFYNDAKGYSITVSLVSVPESFPRISFFETVIESFRFQ